MTMISCPNTEKIIAQTLFLGASVANFTNSIGWGNQPSQLTVNLIDDSPVILNGSNSCGGNRVKMFPDLIGSATTPNDYHTNDNPYVVMKPDGTTTEYVEGTYDPKDRMIPGKVYYDNIYNSHYFIYSDPGFFGASTILDSAGVDIVGKSTSGLIGYDIIDTPVYFRMGDFRFGGLVQSWQSTLSNSGKGYTVTINSMQSLLNSCQLILNRFGGTMFSKKLNSPNGGAPKNYFTTNANVVYNGTIAEGNIPNVFNIYGFIESHGLYNFGGSAGNEEGIAVQKIVDALRVLTGTTTQAGSAQLNTSQGSTAPFSNLAHKHVFSPFGRIIAKSMQVERLYNGLTSDGTTTIHQSIASTFCNYGVIPPTTRMFGNTDTRVQFVLDLSDLPRLPNSFRIKEPVISIMDLLSLIGEQTGHDIYIDTFPLYDTITATSYNVIKVKAISRLTQPGTFAIENTVRGLACANYSISNYTLGKEKNEKPVRSMVIGGSQQRLYQAKSLRLAYTQTNFILDPSGMRFVNYHQLGNITSSFIVNSACTPTTFYQHGKFKFPSFLTTRNPKLIPYYGVLPGASGYVPTGLIGDENNLASTTIGFDTVDGSWQDSEQTSPSINANESKPNGNYEQCTHINQEGVSTTWGTTNNQRWIPIHLDVICPFFGFVSEEELTIKTSENNDFRQIRPVWFDSWTGQSAVVVQLHELPEISISLTKGFYSTTNARCIVNAPAGDPQKCYNRYGGDPSKFTVDYILITESEIRAALAGFDNFLVYSLVKNYKPDLIEMVRQSYYWKIVADLKNQNYTEDEAKSMADNKTNWYWRMTNSNIAHDGLKPGLTAPDKNAGASYVPEDAVKDLQILHKFICDIGKHYGKKYMVSAPHLRSYKDETSSVVLPTAGGMAYIFSGDGKLFYNYEPTNDGAWEEYGNFIDDTIVVGSPSWYALSDDAGKIKPLLGYNASKYFDYVRFAMCDLAAADVSRIKSDEKISAYWDWETYLNVIELYNINCDHTHYIFPLLDFSTLDSSQYVVEKCYNRITTTAGLGGYNSNLTPLTAPTAADAYDAFGKKISDGTYNALKEKLYVTTSVEEKFIYLNPEKLAYPKFLIDSPGLYLNHSSSQYAQDPNRTVLANATIEDLLTYIRTTQPASRDADWMRYMLHQILPVNKLGGVYDTVGNYGDTSNQSALRVEIAPKAAHPFFAGIPIKSNQFSYGPWVNNPVWDAVKSVFSSGNIINENCGTTAWNPNGINAMDNWVGPVEVEVMDEMVPWAYGSSSELDNAAYRYIATKINYQPVIETAQVEMPGLPLFTLSSVFDTGNAGIFFPYASTGYPLTYTEIKKSSSLVFSMTNSTNPGGTMGVGFDPTTTRTNIYTVLVANDTSPKTFGPIVTNIQTSVGAQGISTTYSFRTYSRKLGLFNREQSELIRKNFRSSFIKNKQIAGLSTQSNNMLAQQKDSLDKQRLESAINFNVEGFRSKLYGTSPSTVLIGNSTPFIQEPIRTPKTIVDYSRFTNPGDINTLAGAATAWSGLTGKDQANRTELMKLDTATEVINLMGLQGRYKTSVGLYERKEVDSELNKQFGMKSAMSLDGILSPISFYPTLKNSTFSYSLYDMYKCPFCGGSKIRSSTYSRYTQDGTKAGIDVTHYCDKCTLPDNKLNAKLNKKKSSKNLERLPPYILTDTTDVTTLLNLDSNINPNIKKLPSINLITLNPIVISRGEFKNQNSQNYIGSHPEGVHGSLNSDGFTGRPFVDRLRHSIEIVGRGAIPPGKYDYALETSNNFHAFKKHPSDLRGRSVPKNNLDYYNYDSILSYYRGVVDNQVYSTNAAEMNYRFFSLRGPLTMHGWGYDTEGYPVPNAADEPYEIDQYGRPKRFQLKIIGLGSTTYGQLQEGDLFQVTGDTTYYAKTTNRELLPETTPALNNSTAVAKYKVIDDYSVEGGFDPTGTTLTTGYKGNIISKTQKFVNGGWTEKFKLKEFHLNWAERQDLWPVGPIDLRWDSDRKLWTSQDSKAYKFVYVTLEEDLVKEPDYDETYPTRGFLDDIEYNQEPLPNGFRRLVYIKDKSGYTAPKGTKLLCRYNLDTGYYEPISKPVLVAKGKAASTTTANIEMHYLQGRKSGTVPVTLVTFSNPLGFTVATNDVGIFTYINGIWTLTAKK